MHLYKNTSWKECALNHTSKDIPVNWTTSAIGSVINPNQKSKLKASEGLTSGCYPFFNCSEIQTKFSNSCIVDGENLFITTGGDYMFNHYFDGKAAYSTDVWSVRIEKQHPKYIFYFLKYNFHTNQEYFRGFKFKHLDKKGFKTMGIILPPIEEQNAIASLLTSQESIIKKTKDLIANIEKRNQFMTDELLSGRLRVKEENGQFIFYKNPDDNWNEIKINGEEVNIPKDWNCYKIENIIDIIFGKRIVKSNSTGNIPVYGGGNTSFFTNTYNQKNKWVIARFAMSPNCVRKVDEAFWLLDSGFTFNAKNLNEEKFLGIKFLTMQNYIYNKLAVGTAQKNIDIDAFKQTEILLPSSNEQSTIITVINKLIEEKQRYEKILEKEEKTFNFLLEELMSGRLRIKI